MSKYTITLIAGIVVLVALTVYALKGGPSDSAQVTLSPVPSTSGQVILEPTASVQPGTSVKPTRTPTPGVIVYETRTYEVTMENNKFLPAALTVRKGDVVVFTNLDPTPHTVTAANGTFGSDFLLQGVNWQLSTATLKTGTYTYSSTRDTGMKGTLTIVQ